MGIAIQMFEDDNGDVLPNGEKGTSSGRGLSVAQKATYSISDAPNFYDWLVYSIHPYIGGPAPVTSGGGFFVTTNTMKVMYCPSNERYNSSKNPQFFSYEMVEGNQAGSVSRYCGLAWNPFGYNGGGGLPPRKLSQVSSAGSVADVWAMVDSDQQGNAGAGPAGAFPPVPAHGSTRNYLFFDWHVQAIKVPGVGTGDAVHTAPFYRWKE